MRKLSTLNKIIELIIITVFLVFVGYVINTTLKYSTESQQALLEIKVDYTDFSADEVGNIVDFSTKFEEKLDNHIKNTILNYSDELSSKVANLISITSVFFTVLVVIFSLFQYLKGKSYENKLEEYSNKSEEYYKHLKAIKSQFNKDLLSYKKEISLLIKINSSTIKCMNYTSLKKHHSAVKEYKKIVNISNEYTNILNSLELDDLYNTMVESFTQLGMYDEALNCLRNIIDIECTDFNNRIYLEHYITYCIIMYKKSIKLNDLNLLENTLKLFNPLKIINTSNLDLGFDELLIDLDKYFTNIYISLGKILFNYNKFNDSKFYLEKGLSILQSKSLSDNESRKILNTIYLSNLLSLKANFSEFINNFNFLLENMGDTIYEAYGGIGYQPSCKENLLFKINNSEILDLVLNNYISYAEKNKSSNKTYNRTIRKIYLLYKINNDILNCDLPDNYEKDMKEILNTDCIIERNNGTTPFDSPDYKTTII